VQCRALPLMVLLATSAVPLRAQGEVTIISPEPDTTFRYPVLLLKGEAGGVPGTEVRVVNLTAPAAAERETRTTLYAGRFKALLQLVPGSNRISVTAGESTGTLNLRYLPSANPRVVRVVYLTDRTGDTTYQSERKNDSQDYAAKLDTAAKLLQTFTAERMNDLGLGRRTFNLELDAQGRVQVRTLRAPGAAEHYQAMEGQALWRETQAFLQSAGAQNGAKCMTLMAFTRFDPETRQAKAHTALGGGDLGLFGSAGMFTWPSRLQDAQQAFSDVTRVDGTRTHDDSAYRSTYWAIASTTMGAVLHEMGHTFGLPHTKDERDIMTRGFDGLNRFFTLVEPPHARRRIAHPFSDEEVPYFSPESARRLAAHPFFQP